MGSAAALAAGPRVTRNATGLLVARGATAVSGMLSLPFIYGHLGADRFGVWVLLGGLVAIAAIADLGLGSAMVRQVAAASDADGVRRARAALAVGLVWSAAVALLVFAATTAAWPLVAGVLRLGEMAAEARHAVAGLLCGLLLDGIAQPWRAVLEGIQRHTIVAWATGGTSMLGAGLAVCAVQLGGGLGLLGVSAAAASAGRLAWLVAAARRRARDLAPRPRDIRREDLRWLRHYGLRVQVTSASGAANLELDRLVLGGFFGPAVAGGFDLGGRLLNLVRLPTGMVLLALFPAAVARAAEHGQVWLDRFQVRVTRMLAVLAFLSAAAVMVCADPLVRVWLGEPVWWASVNMVILAPSYALNLVAGATAIVTRVEGRPGRETGYAALSVVLNLALTWPLLKLLGPPGVPLATSVAVGLSTVYFVTTYHRITGRPLRPILSGLWPSMAAAGAGGAAAALLASHLPDGPGRLGAAMAVLSRTTVLALVAGAVLAATGFFGGSELRRLGGVLRGARDRRPMGGRRLS